MNEYYKSLMTDNLHDIFWSLFPSFSFEIDTVLVIQATKAYPCSQLVKLHNQAGGWWNCRTVTTLMRAHVPTGGKYSPVDR